LRLQQLDFESLLSCLNETGAQTEQRFQFYDMGAHHPDYLGEQTSLFCSLQNQLCLQQLPGILVPSNTGETYQLHRDFGTSMHFANSVDETAVTYTKQRTAASALSFSVCVVGQQSTIVWE
jgi:hypothetical protein